MAADGAGLRDGVACGVIRGLVGAREPHAKHPAGGCVGASGAAHGDTERVSGIKGGRGDGAIARISEMEIGNACDAPVGAGLVGGHVARVSQE